MPGTMSTEIETTISPDASGSTPVDSLLDSAVASGDVAAFRAAKREALNGKEPPTAPAPPAEPVKAEPAAPTGEPAGEDAEIAKIPTDQRVTDPETGDVLDRRTRAGKRIVALLGRVKSYEARIAELQAQIGQAQPPKTPEAPKAPASTADSFPNFDAWLAQDGNAEKSYEEYIDARADYRTEQRLAADRAKQHQSDTDRAQAERFRALDEREAAFSKDHPDYAEVVRPAAEQIARGIAKQHPTALALAEFVQMSDQGPAMAYFLGQHPEEHQRLAALPPAVALVELGLLVGRPSQATTPAQPVTPTMSSAPKPPTTLGTKPTGPVDPIEAAVAAGDMSAFRAARLRERTATLR